jgi:lantibiotic modifying enzyme
VGTALDEEEAIEGAAALVDLTRREGGVVDQFDLVFGRAGGVVALLALARFLADPRLLEWAARLGAELVATAERDDGACSWAAPGADGDANLTGLSHGAAGVGHALLELHLATGEAPFRETAVAAFAYERALFDAAAGNWLDVSAPDETGAAAEVRRFVVAWCHGAPGIALTRVRAVELLDDDDCRAEAIAGVGTTREAVRDDLAAGSGNYSLCHGMAGNAEILLLAHPTLDEGRHEDRALAVEVAEAGIERYAASGRWPGGQPEGETPGLMLGLAGTALFYLRLHDPSVPSVLLMGA